MHRISAQIVRLSTLAVALGVASASAQEQPVAPQVEASTNCFATFAIGTVTYCVSEHGNVARFTSPAAAPEHIRIGAIREGYAVCAANVLGGAAAVAYDAGDIEGGWAAAITIIQPGGANTLPLTIVRTTLNGMRLTQSFAHVPNEKEVNITMTLQNVSGATRYNVMLDRYFDGDIAGTPLNDRYTRSATAVWGEEGFHTLMLADINGGAFVPAPAVHTFIGWVPASCGQASIATPTAVGDHVGRLTYRFGDLPYLAYRTVRVQYRKL